MPGIPGPIPAAPEPPQSQPAPPTGPTPARHCQCVLQFICRSTRAWADLLQIPGRAAEHGTETRGATASSTAQTNQCQCVLQFICRSTRARADLLQIPGRATEHPAVRLSTGSEPEAPPHQAPPRPISANAFCSSYADPRAHGQIFCRSQAVRLRAGPSTGPNPGPKPRSTPCRNPSASPKRSYAAAAARAAAGSASAILPMTLSSCAALTNQASKALGGRFTPASSIEWKNARCFAVSCPSTSS